MKTKVRVYSGGFTPRTDEQKGSFVREIICPNGTVEVNDYYGSEIPEAITVRDDGEDPFGRKYKIRTKWILSPTRSIDGWQGVWTSTYKEKGIVYPETGFSGRGFEMIPLEKREKVYEWEIVE